MFIEFTSDYSNTYSGFTAKFNSTGKYTSLYSPSCNFIEVRRNEIIGCREPGEIKSIFIGVVLWMLSYVSRQNPFKKKLFLHFLRVSFNAVLIELTTSGELDNVKSDQVTWSHIAAKLAAVTMNDMWSIWYWPQDTARILVVESDQIDLLVSAITSETERRCDSAEDVTMSTWLLGMRQ